MKLTHQVVIRLQCVHNQIMIDGKSGELIYDYWEDKLIPLDDTNHYDDDRYYTYDRFNEYGALDYETFEDTFTTENGDTVVAFGYYGHD